MCGLMFFRISGNAASNKNIHGTVSEQLKKNFAKSRWKVGILRNNYYWTDIGLVDNAMST